MSLKDVFEKKSNDEKSYEFYKREYERLYDENLLNKKIINLLNDKLIEYGKLNEEFNNLKQMIESNNKDIIAINNKINQIEVISEDTLNSEISMNKDIDEFNKINNRIENNERKYEQIFKSYDTFFNYLFIYQDLKPKNMLKKIQDLSFELLEFTNNVCEKYNLEYSLDGGTLLGAVRHKGFIPWDDDLDIFMMRKESLKFNEVIDFEIENHDLKGVIDASKERHPKSGVIAFTQLQVPSRVFRYMTLAHLDVFPFDYIINPPENIEELFKKAKVEYHKNLENGMNKLDVINDYYKKLNLSFEKQDFIIPCVENAWGNAIKFKLFETNQLLPFKKIRFGDKDYPCFNNPAYYLTAAYGESFRKIPRTAIMHDVVQDLISEEEKLNPWFDEATYRIKKANENFK